MGTKEVVMKMPDNVKFVIEDLRKHYQNPAFRKDEVRKELYGYTKGLRDAGLITERERQILYVYGTTRPF